MHKVSATFNHRQFGENYFPKIIMIDDFSSEAFNVLFLAFFALPFCFTRDGG